MNRALDSQGDWLEDYRPYLTLLARTHVPGTNLDASDVVQQTLIDAFAKRDQYRGTESGELAGWLRQILKHNLTDALRHQQREKRDVRREQALEGDIDQSFCRAEGWLAAVQSSPSQQAVKQEDLLRLAKALSDLPADQCEAITLHHLQGLPLAEVAQQMDRTKSSVAGLLFRGLKTMQNLLCE